MTTMTKLLLIMTAVLTIAPGAAFATDVMSTADGAVVSSRPQFVFDFTEGSARVELSRYADLKTAGDDAGAFVQQDAVDWLAIGPDDGFAPGMTRSWDGRIDAGRYFWHTWISSWVGDAYVSAWTLTRTLTVLDESAVLEGWSVRARRGRTVGRCKRVAVDGKIAWSDNSSDAWVRYAVRLTANGRTVRRITGTSSYGTTYSAIACTGATRLRATIALRDAGGHVTVGPARTLTVAR